MKLLSLAEIGNVRAAELVAETLALPGGTALIPTETVYGLVARFDDPVAIDRIFRLKNRPPEKRLGWFVGDWRKLSEYGVILSGLPERLARQYMPGALTVIAPRIDGGTQGFRIPDHPLLAALLKMFDVPLVQTSANASGMPDAPDCRTALAQLAGEVDCAVDGGSISPGARGSTVADATGERVKILRQGAVDLQNWL